MTGRRITLAIPGEAKPKGSMKCIGGRGKVRHQLIESGDNKDWRARIADTVRTRVTTRAAAGQPVQVESIFILERPGYHYGTGRNAGQLKDRYVSAYPTAHGTGDVDKLTRLVLDALQDGGMFPDDSQVVAAPCFKFYVGHADDPLGYPGARITITL